jgi:hypothetical protein
MESREVVLRALEVLAAAMEAESEEAAIAAVRADVEVLDRETLERVAVALAVMVPRQLVSPSHQVKLAQRAEHLRLELTWAGS